MHESPWAQRSAYQDFSRKSQYTGRIKGVQSSNTPTLKIYTEYVLVVVSQKKKTRSPSISRASTLLSTSSTSLLYGLQ